MNKIIVYYLVLILVLLSCANSPKAEEKIEIEKELTTEQLAIYKKCINSIMDSDIHFMKNNLRANSIRVNPKFSVSIINNFSEELNGDSFKLIMIDDSINKQVFIEPNNQLSSLANDKNPYLLLSFSKPHDNFITAFIQKIIGLEGSEDYLSGQEIGFALFKIRNGDIIEYFDNSVILENF